LGCCGIAQLNYKGLLDEKQRNLSIFFWRCRKCCWRSNLKKSARLKEPELKACPIHQVGRIKSTKLYRDAMATVVTIPLQKSRESLVVNLNELNEDIILILRREDVDLKVWLECGRGLLSQDRVQAYEKLLKSLIDEAQHQKRRPQATFIHVQALCSLADLKKQQARLAEDPEKKRLLFAEANNLYFDAQKVDHQEILPHLGLGELSLSKVCCCSWFLNFETIILIKFN
jgi:hypothetical protein